MINTDPEENVPNPEQNTESPDNTDDKSGEVEKPTATEVGGRKGPEPTRYGDWEKNGIISDF